MLHRIRLAMQSGSFDKLGGEVEVDETFIGGKARNMHKHVRAQKFAGRGTVGKTVVVGIRQRNGEARASIIPDIKTGTLESHVRDHVEEGATTVYTDALASYRGLAGDYSHQTVDHAERYVDGRVHTNGIENFWSLLKRGLHGTYISVQPYHLFRYSDEQAYRYNRREQTDATRFQGVVGMVTDRRVTYAALTGKTA
jgi:transposase-like protein